MVRVSLLFILMSICFNNSNAQAVYPEEPFHYDYGNRYVIGVDSVIYSDNNQYFLTFTSKGIKYDSLKIDQSQERDLIILFVRKKGWFGNMLKRTKKISTQVYPNNGDTVELEVVIQRTDVDESDDDWPIKVRKPRGTYVNLTPKDLNKLFMRNRQ